MQTAMTQGVIFDMDGVLVDSAAAHHQSWQVLAARRGLSVSAERFQQTFGRPGRDIIRIIWGESIGDEEVAQIDADKEVIYRELITGRVPLMPGCQAVLESLHAAGLALAVATSGPPENLDLVLREGGMTGYFAATVHGFDIRHGKPAPDCFLLAARRIGLPPACCVVVEDAPVGIQAAVAAGMSVVALRGTWLPEPLLAAGAACTVQSLEEIRPALIERLYRP
jgi:beta-phosphoglucomutase